tara:strand:+ start:262 stop:747 length:486 start_codon:yes stop_codon:yes gene_type:complete
MKKKDFAKRPYRKGVGAVLLNRQGKVFVARRIDSSFDAWQMPQGGIDKGEKPRRAVLRELHEETGTDKAEIVAKSSRWLSYDLPEEIADTIWKGRYRGQKQRWFALRFTGTDKDFDLQGSAHPEFTDWKWVDMEELPSLIVPFKRDLYRTIVAEFHYLAGR